MATGTLGAGGNIATSNDVYLSFAQDTTETQSVALNDTDIEFLTMNTVDWTVEYSQNATGDDTLSLGIRIVNGATILAAADSGGTFASVDADVTNTTDTTAGPTGFAYVNTGANKTTWDGATIELQQTHNQNMGPDGRNIQVDYVTFDIDYDENQITFGSSASTTSSVSAGTPVVDAIIEGAQASTTDTAGDGIQFVEKLVSGGTDSTTVSATAGTQDLGWLGVTATTTDTGNAFQAIDIVQVGGNASVTNTANAGQTDKQVDGVSTSTTDSANSGAPFVGVGGSSASTMETANAGVGDIFFIVEGVNATEVTFPAGLPKVQVYIAEGILDEWGSFVLAGIDEWGLDYFPRPQDYALNESGHFVDVFSKPTTIYYDGTKATTTDTANPGVIIAANVINGNKAGDFPVANAGIAVNDIVVPGGSDTTTATANAGVGLIEPAANNATTTDTANTGSPFVEVLVIQDAPEEVRNLRRNGSTFVEVDVEGATASESSTVSIGGLGLRIFGAAGITEADVTAGTILLPFFIVVQGGSDEETTTANTGTIGISKLVVTGSRRRTFETPRRGTAVGGQDLDIIYLDEELTDQIFTLV